VLQDALKKSDNSSTTISSTARTPADQARIMYNNLKTAGVAEQKRLYGKFGDQVIDVYESSTIAGKTKDQILQDMVSKINNIGPTNVSKHLSDPNVLQVIDVAPSSITNKTAFVEALTALKAEGRVSNFFTPLDGDPAYHIEIPQPK